MSRTLAGLFAAGLSVLLAAGIHSGVASAAEAEAAELDDGLMRWLMRSRWWRLTPEQPATPTLSDTSYDRLTVSWTEPESAVFEVVDYDMQYRAADTGGFITWAHDGSATEATITGLKEVTEYEVRVRAENEAGKGDWSEVASGTTLLAPPKFVEGETTDREVEENTTAEAAIGAPVRATVPQGELRYSLAGEDAGAFVIDPSSGQLRAGDEVIYDYEARSSYRVQVEAAHESRGTGRIEVQVLVLDVDEPPDKPDAPAVSTVGLTGLLVRWSAPGNTGPAISGYDVQYREEGTEDYLDAGHEGTATSARISGLAVQTLYEVRVRGINDEGTGAWSDTAEGRTGNGGGGTSPPAGPYAPANQRAFDALFVPNFLSTENYFIQFLSGGRFQESNEHRGDYTYVRTGRNTGTITQTYDDSNRYGGSCTVELTFASRNEGTLSYTCAGGQSNTEDWRRDPMDTGSFNIEIIWSTSRRSSVDNATQAAVARWESVITENLGAVYISGSASADPGVIDDVRIYARVSSIDGPGGTLGTGGVRWYRTSSGLPAVSVITLDEDDVGHLSSAGLQNLVAHEIAHALGFGTLWSSLGLLNSPAGSADSNSPLPDTHFSGANAIAAFDEAGGTGYTGAKVPVENDGDFGGVDSHWRIAVFGYGELMVGTFRSRGPWLPMSAITVQSMADLGYSVNAGAADGYGLPLSNAPGTPVLARTSVLKDGIPLKCIVTPPDPTDGITLIELNPDPHP